MHRSADGVAQKWFSGFQRNLGKRDPAGWCSRSWAGRLGGVRQRGGAGGEPGGVKLIQASLGQAAAGEGDPFVVQFEQDGGDQSQERVIVGEDLDDVDAALDPAVDQRQVVALSGHAHSDTLRTWALQELQGL